MQIGQNRTPRTHPLDPSERFVETEMRGMRGVAQSVDDPDVETLEERQARVGNAVDIRRIGERADPEAER